MKYRILVMAAITAVVFSLIGLAPAAQAGINTSDTHMPANPEKILSALVRQGRIAANASPVEQEAAVQNYLQLKSKGGGPDKDYNPLARKQVEANEEALELTGSGSIRGRKLGARNDVPPSSPQFKPLEGSDKLLLIAVQFSETPYTWQPVEGPERTEAGPLHNQMPVPDNSFDLWIPDFSTQHYEDMLFTPGGWTIPAGTPNYAGQHRGSMHDYYLQQSYGKYTVDGDAYGWFTVDKPEAYYGDDRPSGGDGNNLPGLTKDLIADAVAVINGTNAINWAEYDTNGDCFIDHPLFIHAGIDQSGGGGIQGDDAIWAHSSSVWQQVTEPTSDCPEGIYLYNYTIMPEDGGVGVFAHEFGHDLGLPDEYDTIYSGRGDSVGFWSLMSSGSWIGRPAQTQPSAISIWGRYSLGWLTPGDNLAVLDVADLTRQGINLRLEQAERWGGADTLNAIRINLPPKPFYVNAPHSGSYEWFGGKADQLDTTLLRSVDLTAASSATLSFWTWYDIESNWDFGMVQISTDGGATWTSLPIDGTTSVFDPSGMPEIAANLPGFTGNSNGWANKTYDLADYLGQEVMLQFRYMTDWGTTMAGFYLDDISVVADGSPLFFDNVETVDPAWSVNGWTTEQGNGLKGHYYIMEWRNLNQMETPYDGTTIVNFDNGLTNAYSYDPNSANVNEPWYFSYNPGLLLWYRDMAYTDNWTGTHPGRGFLLVVDGHDQAMLRPPYLNYGALPWNSRVQSYDAPFGLNKAYDALLSYWNVVRNYTGLNAVPAFDDSHTYWSRHAPAASVITPRYGLIFRVIGQSEDGSAAVIGFGSK